MPKGNIKNRNSIPNRPRSTRGRYEGPHTLNWGEGIPPDHLAYVNTGEMNLLQKIRSAKGLAQKSFNGIPAYPDPFDTSRPGTVAAGMSMSSDPTGSATRASIAGGGVGTGPSTGAGGLTGGGGGGQQSAPGKGDLPGQRTAPGKTDLGITIIGPSNYTPPVGFGRPSAVAPNTFNNGGISPPSNGNVSPPSGPETTRPPGFAGNDPTAPGTGSSWRGGGEGRPFKINTGSRRGRRSY